MCISVPIIVESDKDLRYYDKFFCVKKVEGQSCLQGKLLEGIG